MAGETVPEFVVLIRFVPLILLSSVVIAQTGDNSEGPFAALAQGLSVDSSTALPGGDAATLVFHGTEFTTTSPTPWVVNPSFPTLPDLAALPFMLVPGLDVDALSMGNDSIASSPTGIMTVGAGAVGGLMFSVSRMTEGAAGGIINREFQGSGGAAADMFTYLQPGSLGSASWIDTPMRSHDSKEISLDAPGLPGNIDAQDVYLGLFFHEAPHMSAFVPNIPAISIYFSVTTASLGVVPSAWWNGQPPSGAVILRTDWLPSSQVWTSPTVAFLPLHFGLLSSEAIDAIALDLSRGYGLFSTRVLGASIPRNPILFVDFAIAGANHVFRRADLVPLSELIGLRVGFADDIDSLSSLEPTRPGPTLPMNHLIGSMFLPLFPGLAGRLSCTTTLRLSSNAASEEIVSRLVGWPTPGGASPGFAAVALTLGSPIGSYVTIGTVFRPNVINPMSIFDGSPEQIIVTIPPSPSFGGVPLWFAWGAFDFSANVFDLTLPVGLVL